MELLSNIVLGYVQELCPTGQVLGINRGGPFGAQHLDHRTTYIDIETAATYRSDGVFDCIVFSESIDSFSNPAGQMDRYAAYLRPGGHMIVSLSDSPGTRKVWKALRRKIRGRVRVSGGGRRGEIRVY